MFWCCDVVFSYEFFLMDCIVGKRMKDGIECFKYCFIIWLYLDCRCYLYMFLIFCFDCKCFLFVFIIECRGVKILDEKLCVIFGNLYFYCFENLIFFMVFIFDNIFCVYFLFYWNNWDILRWENMYCICYFLNIVFKK